MMGWSFSPMIGLVLGVSSESSSVWERDFNSSNLELSIVVVVFELFGRGDELSNLVLQDDM